MRKFFASTLEILEVAIIAVGAVFLIRSFLVQPFLVSGSSMVPNFSNGDYLLIDEITYRFRPPERGEVIVFKYPASPSIYFIKRIIGLPGEEVNIQDNKVTIFNDNHPQGLVLNEGYLSKSFYTVGSLKLKLKPNEYLLLGDNRSASFDSRNWGPLKTDYIVGLARIRLWPPVALTSFAAPQY